MLRHRFKPYIIGVCIFAFLSISCIGYRVYQDHVEIEALIADAETFYHSIEETPIHAAHDHVHSGEGSNSRNGAESGHAHGYHRTEDGHYIYKIAGMTYSSDTPMTQNQIEVKEWIHTGKMTPAVEAAIRDAESIREMFKNKVIQRVVTSDEQLHQVIVPHYAQYEEGAAVYQSDLDPALIAMAAIAQKPWLRNRMEIDGVWHSPPEEYYSIEDPYERTEYMHKFTWSVQHGISMAEVEKRVATGELDASLSEADKRRIDYIESTKERRMMLAPPALPLSDKPPVKVSILTDKGENVLLRQFSESEGGNPYEPEKTSVDSDVPVLGPMQSFLESRLRNLGSERRNESETPTPPPTESIETQYREMLSPERFDKAQQFMDQYGTEEGLRRLRESDPEAARRFESDPDSIEDAEDRHKSRSRRVGTGREQRNPPTHDTSDDAASTQ